jgi:glutathione S-transferase
MMKLYGSGKTRSTRAVWTLEEANAEYEYVPVALMKGEGRQPDYLAINPGGKVPTLVDGDMILTESAAISIHVADKYPEANLIGAPGSPERAKVNQWLFFAIGELEQPLWTLAKHSFAIPESKRVPAIKDTALWEFSVATKVLSKGLGENEYIVGNQFTIADIMLSHTLLWALSRDIPVAQDNVVQYAQRLIQRPALARAFQKEQDATH